MWVFLAGGGVQASGGGASDSTRCETRRCRREAREAGLKRIQKTSATTSRRFLASEHWSILGERFVRVTKQPALAVFTGSDHWMAGRVCVLTGVSVRRAVAASSAPALLTGSKVNPACSDLDAVLALLLLRVFDVVVRLNVFADG